MILASRHETRAKPFKKLVARVSGLASKDMTKLHFVSLGCPKNLVDSEVMLGLLTGDGFVLTDDPEDAEVIVVNTCAFIEDAKKEAIDTLLAMGTYKKKGRCSLLIAAGCLPQRYKEELAGAMPEVDIFVGAGEFPKIVDLIKKWEGGQKLCIKKPAYIYDHETPRLHTSPMHVAYLKIAEGCFHPCSFCVIPKIRGKFRSRPADSIVSEAEGMLSRGVKEINLIAQDSTGYGRDIGTNISRLIERLADLPFSKWIRLFYAYPHGFPSDLIDVIEANRDICRYIDIPIQHVSDRILKAMKRRGEGKEIRKLICKIRSELPDVSIRTSLITGFPGETQDEHNELLDFVCEMKFEHLGVFEFSPEEGTAAARLKKRVHPMIARERMQEIMGVQREISFGNNLRKIGKKINVLVEGASRESEFLIEARHEGQGPEIDGVVYINEVLSGMRADSLDVGEFQMVEITDAHDYDLVGKICNK